MRSPRGEIPNQAPPTTVATAPRGAHAVDDVEFADGFASGNNAREAVDLSADPFADDLTAELAAAAPKPWHNRATVVLGALVLIVGGFLGGVQVEKHYGKTTTAANARAALSQFANARGGAGGTGGFGRGAANRGYGHGRRHRVGRSVDGLRRYVGADEHRQNHVGRRNHDLRDAGQWRRVDG